VLTAKPRDGHFPRRLDREMWDRTGKLEYSVHDRAQTAHHELAVRRLQLRNSSLKLLKSGAVHVIDGRKIDDDAAEAAVVRAGQRPTEIAYCGVRNPARNDEHKHLTDVLLGHVQVPNGPVLVGHAANLPLRLLRVVFVRQSSMRGRLISSVSARTDSLPCGTK
jgi:hypothetical protein